jgi:hypothetical protein
VIQPLMLSSDSVGGIAFTYCPHVVTGSPSSAVMGVKRRRTATLGSRTLHDLRDLNLISRSVRSVLPYSTFQAGSGRSVGAVCGGQCSL